MDAVNQTNQIVMLLKLISILIMSMTTASLSWFLQFLYLNTPIFKDYYAIIKKYYRFYAIKRGRRVKIFFPFGLCVYCQSTWLAICGYLFLLFEREDLTTSLVLFPLFLGFNYVMTEFVSILINKWGYGL